MVRVITIMDDIYTELSRLKKSKGMSFSELFRYLLKESNKEGKTLIGLAGSIGEDDLDRRALGRSRSGNGKNMLG